MIKEFLAFSRIFRREEKELKNKFLAEKDRVEVLKKNHV